MSHCASWVRCAALASVAGLAGCYTPDRGQLASDVLGSVAPGMPIAEASARLLAKGFYCDGKSMAGAVTCTRTRQRLLPSACIERVNLFHAAGATAVSLVDVPPIACAGF